MSRMFFRMKAVPALANFFPRFFRILFGDEAKDFPCYNLKFFRNFRIPDEFSTSGPKGRRFRL